MTLTALTSTVGVCLDGEPTKECEDALAQKLIGWRQRAKILESELKVAKTQTASIVAFSGPDPTTDASGGYDIWDMGLGIGIGLLVGLVVGGGAVLVGR